MLSPLTVVPVYCARFLRKSDADGAHTSWSERAYLRLQNAYGVALVWMLRRKFVTLSAVALLIAVSVPLYYRIGTELFPQLDTGQFRDPDAGPFRHANREDRKST